MKLRQYKATVVLQLSRVMEYRGNFLFKLAVTSIIPLIIKISLFHAFFMAHGGSVAGYSEKQVLIYQLWGALIIILLEIRSTLDNVAIDIRMGRITKYLLYPISFFEIVSCQYLAQFFVQLFCLAIGLFLMTHFVDGFQIFWGTDAFYMALIFTLWGSLFWYLVYFTVGLVAFWLEEIWTFIIIFQMSARFLSGNPIPLDMFPQKFVVLSYYLPFHWIFFAPVKMLSEGKLVANTSLGLYVLTFWTCILLMFYCFLWKTGLKKYSAAGM